MSDNSFKGTVESLFKGVDGMISSKTVVGDAIHIGDTIILPLVDVSFGLGAGGRRHRREDNPLCCPCHPEWEDEACKY